MTRKAELNPHKIAFITCVNDEELYEECLLYLRHLEIPTHFQLEYIKIKDAPSMTRGYNEGMQKTSAKYKIYLHQDVLLIRKNFLWEMLSIFQAQDVGMLGIIGSKMLPQSAIWWDGEELFGTVIHSNFDEMPSVAAFQKPTSIYEEVEALDGLLLATRYDIKWREDFDDWHFYDLAAGKEFQRKSFKTVVMRQDTPYAIHLAKKKILSDAYHKAQSYFLKTYQKELYINQ